MTTSQLRFTKNLVSRPLSITLVTIAASCALVSCADPANSESIATSTSTSTSTSISTSVSTTKKSSTSTTKTPYLGDGENPHSHFIASIQQQQYIDGKELDDILKESPLELRKDLEVALVVASSGNSCTTEYDCMNVLDEKLAHVDPDDLETMKAITKDNVDFRRGAIQVVQRYVGVGPSSYVGDRIYNKAHLMKEIDELRMTEEERDAADKAEEYFFSYYDYSWQDAANAYAEHYYRTNSGNYNEAELRDAMTKAEFPAEHIDNSIKYLNEEM